MSEDNNLPTNNGARANLPARLPSASLMLHRTQTTLGLLQDVIQESSAEYWYDRGKKANASAEWDEGVFALQQCLVRNAQHWQAELHIAVALLPQKTDDAASAILRAYQGPYQSWSSLADELPSTAWQQLQTALEEHKHLTADLFNLILALSLVYRVVKKPELARQALDTLKFLHPDRADQSVAWLRQSGALWKDKGELTLAVIDYDKVISLHPDCAPVYTSRGNIKYQLGDMTAALADYDRVVTFGPAMPWLLRRRGYIRYLLKDYVGSLADYDRTVELDPDWPDIFIDRGKTRKRLGDRAGAIADYDRAIKVQPDDADAYFARGFAKMHTADNQQSIDDFSKSIELGFDKASAYFWRGITKKDLGNTTGALADYDLAIHVNPEYAAAYFHRGNIKRDQGNHVGALADYNSAILLNISVAKHKAYYNRAITRAELDDLAGALADLDEALSIAPAEASYYKTRAWIREEFGDIIGATADRQKVEELSTK